MCGKKAGHPTLGVDVGEASPDDSNSNTASAQGGEIGHELSEDGPCIVVDLNSVFVILEEDHT